MALIEVYHTIASYYPVEADHFSSADPTAILEGQFVKLDANGNVKQAERTNAIGVAGDTLSQTTGATPFAADLVIGTINTTRSTSNRVSDFFNETLASGKMTVYVGTGEFYTDQYLTGKTWTPGNQAYATDAGLLTPSTNSSRQVGWVVEGPKAYPSGVPGTDTTDGSLSLGNFARFILSL